MSLRDTRAAFEKAVTDAVTINDPTISMVFDNLNFNTPGQEQKYVVMNVNYSQSTVQPQGAALDYYSGVIQCNIHVPKNSGTRELIEISEKVIDGLTSVNASKLHRYIFSKTKSTRYSRAKFIDIEEEVIRRCNILPIL